MSVGNGVDGKGAASHDEKMNDKKTKATTKLADEHCLLAHRIV